MTMKTMMMRRCFLVLSTAFVTTDAFSIPKTIPITKATTTIPTTTALHHDQQKHAPGAASAAVATIALISTILGSNTAAMAYESTDYASETVTQVISELKNAQGKTAETFRAYEDVAAIITEGKGVGGAINYKGVQLDRGYISDEDTAIYNPGLTLLTESEKERLVEAITDARTSGQTLNTWNEDNQLAYEFLTEKLDPLHMRDLKGYLGILPIYAGVLYLGVLGVQQLARDLFSAAYIGAAALIFLPIVALIAIGPQ